jgi:hypothetical protein
MFSFIFALFSFSVMFFADEIDGGGSNGGEGDNSAGGDDGSGVNGSAGEGDNGSQGGEALTPEEIAAARAIIEQNNTQSRLNAAETSIKSRIPDFDMSKVVTAIQELHKTNPEEAARYNQNEASLELFWRDKMSNVAKGDAHNSGSHKGGKGDFDDTIKEARGGSKEARKTALAMAKA